VNLWATWCVPCVAELRAFAKQKAALDGVGVKVLALSVDGLAVGGDGVEPGVFFEKLGVSFEGGKATEELMRRVGEVRRLGWGVRWDLPVPSSLLLDGEGRLVALYSGPVEVARVVEDAGKVVLGDEAFHDASLPFAGTWIERPRERSLLALALAMMGDGDLDGAIDFIGRAGAPVSGHREFGKLMTWVGDELMERGDSAEGLAAYERALRVDGDNLLVLNNLAWQLAAHEDPAVRDGLRAVEWAEKAAGLAGDDAAILDTLAAAYAEAGDFRKAVETGERAAALAERARNRVLWEGIQKGLGYYRRGRAFGR
ncbi:MAG: hypothetical protein P8J87_08740, partial [Verrucomicrobiales bacterium]|nr:hypothetical protein [Verrucomicrobiales bacterium]